MQSEIPAIIQYGMGGLFLVVGLLALYAGAKRLRKAWVLVSASEGSVAELSAGEVAAVSGEATALSEERVEAELLGEEGLLVGTSVDRYSRNDDGAGNGSWKTFHDSVESAPMAVEDDTGRVEVDPPTADDYSGNVDFVGSIAIDRAAVASASGESAPSGASAYAEGRQAGRSLVGDSRRRYQQGTVEEGDEVYVLGEVVRENGREVISGPADTNAFVVSTDGKPSSLVQLFFAAFIGLFGVVGTVAGLGLLAFPYLT